MQRRDFLAACAGCAALANASSATASESRFRSYARVRLVGLGGQPVRAGELVAGRNYIFHYPYEGTPCFLIELGRPTSQNVTLRTEHGTAYQWSGGVGPKRSIVAYSAICTHRMSYPTRQISFISYRERSSASTTSAANMIHCCSEHSEYDPASGARVIRGPAPQPLSGIVLEHEPATDSLYATGTTGAEIYSAFFSKYELRLEMDYGSGRARQRVTGTALVMDLESFCKQQVRC
jgi:Rieske Fe-S protein